MSQMFMGTVGLVFAPLAPLVAVGAAIVMWASSWVYKYQLMFSYVSKVETGGVSPLPSWVYALELTSDSAYGTRLSTVSSSPCC
jgi:Calcium-dependent channel, 7TM region, putative phosphate